MTITANDIRDAIMEWPSTYQTKDGRNLVGCPVSAIPTQLRQSRRRWRNVSQLNDEYDLEQMGLEVVTARYVQGARPKRFCRVVVATWR